MGKYFIFIPNLLSIIRIFLMYPLLTFILEENFLFALYIFAIAAATDGLDGYLARVMDWQTDLGKILDPIADKVLLVSIFIVLGAQHMPFLARQNASNPGRLTFGRAHKPIGADRYFEGHHRPLVRLAQQKATLVRLGLGGA